MVEGTVQPDFAALRPALEQQLRSYPGGAAIAVYSRGELVADLWGGTRDAIGTPWTRDTMSVSFSTTKGVASTALHMLVDRRLIAYDDPVAKCWPEFAAAGKEGILVRHVLCHEAGLYDVRSLIQDSVELLDWERMTDLLARAAPAHPPGTRNAYHALTYGYLVGEIIRRVTGTTFSEFVQREIAQPLGLDGFYVGTPEHEWHRVARLIRPARAENGRSRGRPSFRNRAIWSAVRFGLRLAGLPTDFQPAKRALAPRGIAKLDFSAPEVISACIPAANGVFTARSLARMYACLANGGELDGVCLMSAQAVAHAAAVQSGRPDHVLILPMHWRMGYHMVGTLRGISKHAFGHFGYGGSGAWAHPLHKLSFAMIVNGGHGTPLGDLRMARMSGIVLACARRRR